MISAGKLAAYLAVAPIMGGVVHVAQVIWASMLGTSDWKLGGRIRRLSFWVVVCFTYGYELVKNWLDTLAFSAKRASK